MSNSYYYLDIELKLRTEDGVVLTPAYLQGSIEQSLESFFGEIGGKADLEIVKFEESKKRAIIKVHEEFYKRTRTAITLIGEFQNIPCHFVVHKSSKLPIVD